MCAISSSTRSVGDSESSWEDGGITASFTGRDFYEDLIFKANSVPILSVFNHYNVAINENNKKIICPFPGHKDGRENTPSFVYYPETNTFWCFGCTTGTSCVDFVVNFEKISRVDAAYKILDLFNNSIVYDLDIVRIDSNEKLQIMIEFSDAVRAFLSTHQDEKAREFIDKICRRFDIINDKLRDKLTIDALKFIVAEYKYIIDLY